MNIYSLFQRINQYVDINGNSISRSRKDDLLKYNLNAWEQLAKSDFFAKCVTNPSNYPKYSRDRGIEADILESYNDYVEELLVLDGYSELPSKLFVMGDIGIYKVEKESIIISFDISVNIGKPEELFINNLHDFDTQNEVKPYEYRKNVLNYLFSAINSIDNNENEYANFEIPLMPRINKLIRLLYMYFSGKGIFSFEMVDDLTMLNIYKRENLSRDDIIGDDPFYREVYRGKQIVYPGDMNIKDRITPEDIVYTIDKPLSHAELMTLLGKYDNDLRKISICVINIERAAQYLTMLNSDYYNYETKRALLIKKVFYHEMGHMIFRKISPKQLKPERETTANWVACLSYDRTDLDDIRAITYALCREQTEDYKNPLKIPDFERISLNEFNDYCTKLEKILEKIYG